MLGRFTALTFFTAKLLRAIFDFSGLVRPGNPLQNPFVNEILIILFRQCFQLIIVAHKSINYIGTCDTLYNIIVTRYLKKKKNSKYIGFTTKRIILYYTWM